MTSGLLPALLQRRGERVQHVDRVGARLVDVDRLEPGRGGVQDLQVQRRLAAGGQRLLEPDAEAVDGGRGQAEALGEVAQVRVAEAVDLDERHALALTLQPRALQRGVVVGGQVLVGGEARLRHGVGAAGRGAGPLQIARLVGGGLVSRPRPPCAGTPRCSDTAGVEDPNSGWVSSPTTPVTSSRSAAGIRTPALGRHEAWRHGRPGVGGPEVAQRGAEQPPGLRHLHRRVGEQAGDVDLDAGGAGALEVTEDPGALGGGRAEALGQVGDRVVLAVLGRLGIGHRGGEPLEAGEVGLERERQRHGAIGGRGAQPASSGCSRLAATRGRRAQRPGAQRAQPPPRPRSERGPARRLNPQLEVPIRNRSLPRCLTGTQRGAGRTVFPERRSLHTPTRTKR